MIILKLIILFVVANVFVAVVFTMDDIKEIKDIEKANNNNSSDNHNYINDLRA